MGRAVFTGRLLGGMQALRPIDPVILAQCRTTISLLVLAPILLLRSRPSLRVRGSHLVQFFLLGILGLAASNFFYYFAIEKTTVATAIVLQYVAPVWVLLYMLARRLQRPTARRISGVVLAVIGCGLAVGGIAAQRGFPWLAISGPRFNTLGVIAAEMAAISFAFYNVYGQHLLQIYNRWTVLVYASARRGRLLAGRESAVEDRRPALQWRTVAVHGGVCDCLDAGAVLPVLHRTAVSRSHACHRDRLPGAGVGDSADRHHPGRTGLADAGGGNRGCFGRHDPDPAARARGPQEPTIAVEPIE